MWKFKKNDNIPIYLNISNHIEMLILNQKLSPYDKLPSIRKLSELYGVNKDTIVSAYKLLENKGYLYKISGKGTYIKEFRNIEIENLELERNGYKYDFSSAIISTDYFPVKEFKQSFDRVLSRDKGSAFAYHEAIGYYPLREEIIKILKKNDIKTKIDNVMIISGAQQGIDIVSRSLLTKNDKVFVENPTYKGAYYYFKSMGVKITGIPFKNCDLDIENLEKELNWRKPKLVYTMPNFHNPTGYSYSKKAKQDILNLAEEYDFFIIEDDYTNEINYGNDVETLKSLDKSDRVIYIKSFSKILMPGLRVSFIIVPDCLIDSFKDIKAMTDISTSGILQRTLTDFMSSDNYKKHIEKINDIFKKRIDTVDKLLEKYMPKGVEYEIPNGGISFWIKLPSGVVAEDLIKEAIKQGMFFNIGTDFFINKNKKNSKYIRLSFGNIEDELLEEGIKNLSRNVLKCIYKKQNKIIIY